jgi:hypothetical protein
MDKKTAALICVIALLTGSVVYFWANRAPVIPAIEAEHTGQIVGEIKDTVETVTARIERQDAQTRTEVRVIRETVRAKVNALSADSVADGLNAELTIFRGMEASAGGMDGN